MLKRTKKLLLLLSLTYFPVLLYFRSQAKAPPIMIAHRGAAGLAPENTLVGIEKAMEQGATFVEVDIQRSSDNVLLLIHDETVSRTTDGQGAVRDLTWAEIRTLDAGSYFASEFAEARIPSLAEAFELIKNKPVTLVLELKSPHLYPQIEQDVSAAIEEHQVANQVVIISFDTKSLQAIHKQTPDIPLGILPIIPLNVPEIQPEQRVDLFWLSVLLDPTLIHRLHQKGYQVWVWTVNNLYLMRWLVWLGVDGVTTDRPDLWNEIKPTDSTA